VVQEIFVRYGWIVLKPAGRDERVTRHSPLYSARAKALKFQCQDRCAQLLIYALSSHWASLSIYAAIARR
jgi:hypothetical protein